MATQQRPGQEGGKVHKNLPQQRGHLLQSALKLGGDTVVKRKVRERDEEERSEEKIIPHTDRGRRACEGNTQGHTVSGEKSNTCKKAITGQITQNERREKRQTERQERKKTDV